MKSLPASEEVHGDEPVPSGALDVLPHPRDRVLRSLGLPDWMAQAVVRAADLVALRHRVGDGDALEQTLLGKYRRGGGLLDLDRDLQEIVELVPPGVYERQRLCDQLNSALAAHGWSSAYGTVE